MQLPSRLIEAAVDQMATLPGIGRRTALRLVLNMLARDEEKVKAFADAMVAAEEGVRPCSQCHNPTEDETYNLCTNPRRVRSLVCVVEDVRDLLALESMGEYRGLYHVLGGVISPMDGVGPADLFVDSLVHRAANEEVKEVIFALPGSMEGDTTAFYLAKRLSQSDVLIHSTGPRRGCRRSASIRGRSHAVQFDVESLALQGLSALSVVIVSYNVRAFLEQCLVSVERGKRIWKWRFGWWTTTAWMAQWPWFSAVFLGYRSL